FVASLKPYVLTNAHDLPDEEFRAAYTTAGGAYLLDRACDRLPEILRAVREPRLDRMAAERRTLKEYVLGPDHPTSMARFNAAVDALADKGAADQAWHGPLGVSTDSLGCANRGGRPGGRRGGGRSGGAARLSPRAGTG
ncbi:hypothetical protein ACFU45_44150, partial [Streptomyces sp. NPDC057403]